MAYDRKSYTDKLFHLRYQLVENWCLIKYCNLYDEENYNRLHWCRELLSHMSNLQKMDLKKRVDKYRATIQELIEKAELDDEDVVYQYCLQKWDEEGLPKKYLKTISKELANNIEYICELISEPMNYEKLKNYVYNEI